MCREPWRGALVLAATLAAGACGYRFSAGTNFPEGIKSLCVPVMINRTAEPAIEVAFTGALRERLIRAGASRAGCEAEVRGEIIALHGGPTVGLPRPDPVTGSGLASYRLYSHVVLRLFKGDRKISEVQVVGNEDYLPGADILEAEANRQSALTRLTDAMMRDAYVRLSSGW